MDAAAELGRNPVSKHQIQPEYHTEMSRLTRDGTAEPVSRDQILRHARGQGNIIFPVQLTTSRIGNLIRLIHTLLYVMTIHTYIHRIHQLLTWTLPLCAPAETVEYASRTVEDGGRERLWSGCEPKPVSADQMHPTHGAQSSRAHETANSLVCGS